MALSDYAHMAFDSDGKSCDSHFAFKNGFAPELYKNWVYLHHPRAWKTLKKPSYIKDTLAQISSCNMTMGDVVMIVERTKDHRGCLVFMYTSHYHKNKPTEHEFFSGMAVYGWDDEVMLNLKRLGREAERNKFEWHTSTEYSGKKTKNFLVKQHKKTYKVIEQISIPATDYDTLWLGINDDRLKEFHAFIKRVCGEHGLDAYAKKVTSSEAKQHNPGSVFLAGALGLNIKKDSIGKKEAPLLMKALAGKKS